MPAADEWKLLLDLVSREFGLVFQDSRRRHLEGRLSERLGALGLESFAAYARYLARHPEGAAELRALAGRTTSLTASASFGGTEAASELASFTRSKARS